MPEEVEIAVVGTDIRKILPARDRPWVAVTDDEAAKQWHEHDRRAFRVEDDETLASVLGRASAEFRLYENTDWSLGYGTGRYLALRDDKSSLPLQVRLRPSLTLVDGSGQAVWGIS